jgi:hypothetical protein
MATAAAQSEVNPLSDPSRAAVEAAPVVRIEHQEDLLTRMIEHQAAKIPSNTFLFAAICAMGLSFGAELTGRYRSSRFIGMWVSPLLTMGLYNKMVKLFGAR